MTTETTTTTRTTNHHERSNETSRRPARLENLTLDHQLQTYLDGFRTSIEARMTALEREANQTHRNMLTGDKAQEIFRTTTLKVNSMTRLAVAIIAAVAVGANGTVNVITNHNREVLARQCGDETQKRIEAFEVRFYERSKDRDRELIRETIEQRDRQIDDIIAKATRKATP